MKVGAPSLQTPEVGGCEHLVELWLSHRRPDGLYGALPNCLAAPSAAQSQKEKAPEPNPSHAQPQSCRGWKKPSVFLFLLLLSARQALINPPLRI